MAFALTPNSALALIADAHHQALQILATFGDQHYQGLAQAARAHRQLLPRWLTRRLVQLDVAFGVMRHITSCSMASLIHELQDAIALDQASNIASEGSTHYDDATCFSSLGSGEDHESAPVVEFPANEYYHVVTADANTQTMDLDPRTTSASTCSSTGATQSVAEPGPACDPCVPTPLPLLDDGFSALCASIDSRLEALGSLDAVAVIVLPPAPASTSRIAASVAGLTNVNDMDDCIISGVHDLRARAQHHLQLLDDYVSDVWQLWDLCDDERDVLPVWCGSHFVELGIHEFYTDGMHLGWLADALPCSRFALQPSAAPEGG